MTKYLWLVTLLAACSSEVKTTTTDKTTPEVFDVEKVKPIIIENGKKWSIGTKNKDMAILSGIYDQNAHYLPDAHKEVLHGNKAVSDYWKASLEAVEDIQLSLESLEGTKEILYETGHGFALVKNAKGKIDTAQFKYVNVWKLQTDGTYKVVIDTFNDVK